jgi:hypothetical protein
MADDRAPADGDDVPPIPPPSPKSKATAKVGIPASCPHDGCDFKISSGRHTFAMLAHFRKADHASWLVKAYNEHNQARSLEGTARKAREREEAIRREAEAKARRLAEKAQARRAAERDAEHHEPHPGENGEPQQEQTGAREHEPSPAERTPAPAKPPLAAGGVQSVAPPAPSSPSQPQIPQSQSQGSTHMARSEEDLKQIARLPEAEFAVVWGSLTANEAKYVGLMRSNLFATGQMMQHPAPWQNGGYPQQFAAGPYAPGMTFAPPQPSQDSASAKMENLFMEMQRMEMMAEVMRKAKLSMGGSGGKDENPQVVALQRQVEALLEQQKRAEDERRREREFVDAIDRHLKPMQEQLAALKEHASAGSDPTLAATLKHLEEELKAARDSAKDERWSSAIKSLENRIEGMRPDASGQMKPVMDSFMTMLQLQRDGNDKSMQYVIRNLEREIDETRHMVHSRGERDTLDEMDRIAKFLDRHSSGREPSTADKLIDAAKDLAPAFKPMIDASAQRVGQPRPPLPGGGANGGQGLRVDCVNGECGQPFAVTEDVMNGDYQCPHCTLAYHNGQPVGFPGSDGQLHQAPQAPAQNAPAPQPAARGGAPAPPPMPKPTIKFKGL